MTNCGVFLVSGKSVEVERKVKYMPMVLMGSGR